MRTTDPLTVQQHLGAAAWVPRETEGVEYPWPALFGELGDEYERRYGLDPEHLAEIARINFANATHNPNAQARDWQFEDADLRGAYLTCSRMPGANFAHATLRGARLAEIDWEGAD